MGLAAVEQRDGVAACERGGHDVRADEAGTAEHQHGLLGRWRGGGAGRRIAGGSALVSGAARGGDASGQ
jgi:hypothetical protein